MLGNKQVTGDQHEEAQSGNSMGTATSLKETVCLCSMPKESKAGASESAFHVDGFESEAADDAARPSALHLAERIVKKLMKLRKKAALCSVYASCLSFSSDEPCREAGSVSKAEPRTHSLDSADVAERDVRCGYDSDEQSAGFVSISTPTSSSSSFDSAATSHGASTLSVSANSEHKSGSQMMANMLLSLLSNDDGYTLDEADDEADSGEDSEEYHFGGPRASAWHQPEEEILTEQEWRMMRYRSKPAISATSSSSSTPKLRSKPSSSLRSFTILPPHHPSTTLGSKPRESFRALV